MLSLISLMSFIRIFKYLQFNSQMYFLWTVIGRARSELVAFGVMLAILLGGFAVCGSLAFGHRCSEFSSTYTAVFSLLQMQFGDFDGHSCMRDANAPIAYLMYTTYMILVTLCFTNLVIAMLSNVENECRQGHQGSSSGIGQVDYDFFKWINGAFKELQPRISLVGEYHRLGASP